MIQIEVQHTIDGTWKVNPEEHNNYYRFWQKSRKITANSTLGMGFACLLAIVFVFGRKTLPESILSGIR